MTKQKQIEGQTQVKDLWNIPFEPVTIQDFAKNTIETEKTLWFGTSNSGKTKGYLDILAYWKAKNIPAEQVMMCIIFPDRATGLTKLYKLIPKEYVTRVFVYTVNCYEDVIKATADSEKRLIEHYNKTKNHGWLMVELLEEIWRMSQDYYSRQAFGETLADYLALQRDAVKEKMKKLGQEDKDNAFKALGGWQDWSIIKFFHNFNWIDKIKKMPFNVGATSEVKKETNKDSIFFEIGVCPAGEKDNEHRFDTIIYKSHRGNNFYQQCFKLTGYTRIYAEVDITDKNSYSVHKKILKQFEDKGYCSSAIEELEEEAGIVVPKQKEIKQVSKEMKFEPIKEKTELKSTPTNEQKSIKEISGTQQKETTQTISKEEFIKTTEKVEEKKEEKKAEKSDEDFDWNV